MPKFFAGWQTKKNGFMLVDSMVAVVIVAIGLVAILQLYNYGMEYQHSASLRQKAVQIASENIERIKSLESEGKSELAITSAMTTLNSQQSEGITAQGEEIFYPEITAERLLSETSGSEYKGDDRVLVIKSTVRWPKDKTQQLNLYAYIELP